MSNFHEKLLKIPYSHENRRFVPEIDRERRLRGLGAIGSANAISCHGRLFETISKIVKNSLFFFNSGIYQEVSDFVRKTYRENINFH